MNANLKKTLSAILAVAMVVTLVPMSMFMTSAAGEADVPTSMEYITSQVTPLAPGVDETKYTVLDANGNQVVYYAISAPVASSDTVQVKANYHDNDNTGVWGKATVVEQANAAKEKRGYNVVASTNAAYYNVSTGQPTGGFVMEGVNINGDAMGNSYPFFAIMKDGTAMIGQKGTFSQYSSQIQEAIAGHTMLLWDGEVVATDNVSKYPRSTVGIKANGDVVLMLADGNQAPYSVGLTLVEQAQVMQSLGCVVATELDGGGSATYAAKPEGTDEVVVRNSCCDGTVRSVSNTLMVISTAVADGTFDHANLSTAYLYYAPYSDVTVKVVGADAAGGPADVPADGVSWRLSDDSFGTVADGVFTSNGKLGEVTVEMIYNDEVAGSATINVVNPNAIAFDADEKSIPYGKTTALTVNAMYGLNEVFMSIDALNISLSDNAAAKVNGAMFTAAVEESGKTGVTVTATYKYAEIETASVTYKFGKESSVLFDFENDDGSLWTTDFDTAKAALPGKNINDIPNSGNGTEKGLRMDSYISNDYAKTGHSSLAVNIDYTQSESHGNWMYMYLYYLGEPVVYRDVENGILGTRLGMWMYIPEEAVGMCARLCYAFDNNGTMNGNYLYFTYQYVAKGFSKITSETIPEAGWAYVYVDFFDTNTTGCGSDYFSSLEPGAAANNKGAASDYYPGFIQFIASSSYTGCENMTFYIDDVTLDYGDVAPDRDAPVISNMKVYSADGLTGATLDDNNLVFNQITVNANVAEDLSHAAANATGLDTATAQVYVDGQKVSTNVVNGIMSSDIITLPNGVHDITFEIADNTGNYTKITKQVTINAETTYPVVTLDGQASTEGYILSGSVYNMLLNVDQIEKIQSVTTTIHLGGAHEFELEGLTVPAGFTATADVNEASRTLTLTVERTGESDLTGAATLATIPARMWYWNSEETGISAIDQWNGVNGGGACTPVLTFDYKIKSGSVKYVDGYTVTETGYVAGFSNMKASEITELNTGIGNLKNAGKYWHVHADYSDTWTTSNKTASCIEAGYTGRVTCTECNSVIDWGTAIPAAGHNYGFEDGVLGCTNDGCDILYTGIYEGIEYIDGVVAADGWCGEYYYNNGAKLTGIHKVSAADGSGDFYYNFGADGVCVGKYTGLITDENGIMYAMAGTLRDGWREIDGNNYYFDPTTYYAYTNGVYTVGIHEYTFNENGVLIKGSWTPYNGGTGYIFAGAYALAEFMEIDGNTYWFDNKGCLVTGTQVLQTALGEPLRIYVIDDTGIVDGILDYTGVYDLNGTRYYVIDGEVQKAGALVWENNTYYASTNTGKIATGLYYVNAKNGNGIITESGYYNFGTDGKLVIEDNSKGSIQEMNGYMYYFIDGEVQKCGVFELDGATYYASTNTGRIATGLYYVNAKNGNGIITEDGYYNFGTDGKLITEDSSKGSIKEMNGYKYYFIDGEVQKCGAFELDGATYYASTNTGRIATGIYYVNAKNGNGIITESGNYNFGTDGKLVTE